MKKGLKISLGIGLIGMGAMLFTGCTASFCSNEDTSHILYCFDYGVTKYYNASEAPAGAQKLWEDNNNIYYTLDETYCSGFKNIIENGRKNNIYIPYDLSYFQTVDNLLLEKALAAKGTTHASITDASQINSREKDNLGLLFTYGYLKYCDDSLDNKAVWGAYDDLYAKASKILSDEGKFSLIPSTDFVAYYKNQMNSYVTNYRACFAIEDGYYGNYGYAIDDKETALLTSKDWGYAWSKGFFEGLLVYPIGWLVETFARSFSPLGQGGAAILAIVLVTVIVRGIMLLFTFNQAADSAKMTELQPQIAKIQEKYPNSKTNQYEKQRMSEEMSKLYKKNNVHPFRSIITMVIQFPIFICVWGALQGSASLSTGSFLGLNLNAPIRDVLFNGAYWSAENLGGLTALILFLLMAIAQAAAMLLPQILQKIEQKKVAKLGKNPSVKSQNNSMKWFTYIMLGMIIIMGFSLASAMGVYWFIGALMSIAQTLISRAITKAKKKKAKGN